MTTETKPPLLLWCDFETDGLDIAKLEILEACFVLTDTNLVELDRYTTLVKPRSEVWKVLSEMGGEVLDMHMKSGLVEALVYAPHADVEPWTDADNVGWIVADKVDQLSKGFTAEDRRVVLAGAGVAGFDRHVIRTWMPELDKRLTYWCIDTSAVDRFANLFAGIDRQSGDAAHRAEADVEHALGVAKVWQVRMRALDWSIREELAGR